ncbi:MAG TPA: permease, partial [Acidimicrobiales bacterium]
MVWLVDIGRSAQQAGSMLWQTLWPLLIGFGLSGGIQAFASPARLGHRLGTHRPKAILWASGYGMASSSCSYAATATARSLFAKGADFVSSVVYMFAATNLVIEMGLVLATLLGWQFVAGEFLGGTVMIVLLAGLGGLWLLRGRSGAHLDELRATQTGTAASAGPPKVTSTWRDGVADAVRFTIADLTMVRREVLIGFGVAGVLATVVPSWLWNDLFLHGHGIWTSLENALVGPLIAMVSFT